MYLAKRILAFLLCLVTLLSVVGCNSVEQPSGVPGTQQTESSTLAPNTGIIGTDTNSATVTPSGTDTNIATLPNFGTDTNYVTDTNISIDTSLPNINTGIDTGITTETNFGADTGFSTDSQFPVETLPSFSTDSNTGTAEATKPVWTPSTDNPSYGDDFLPTESATETPTASVTTPSIDTSISTDAPVTDAPATNAPTETLPPTETVPSTETAPPKPTTPSKVPEGHVQIAENGYAYYRVIYENGLPSIVKTKLTKALANIETKLGITMEVYSDAQLPTPSSDIPEILIGDTNRAASHALAMTLRTGEYKVVYDKNSKNILLAGGGFSALGTVIDSFFADNLNKLDRYFSIPENYKLEKLLDFPIQSVLINGVAIQEYVIVYSSTADKLVEYAALNLSDYIETNMGVKLKTVTDKTAEQQYEFLIGTTKRTESKISSIPNGKYILMEKDGKIVMQGKGIYVGAAVGAFVSKLPANGKKKEIVINDLPTTAKAEIFKFPSTFKNAVIMIGDGMGFNHVEAAKNSNMGEFYAEQFPNKGKARTRSQSVIDGNISYTDSAAAATALATGYKTKNGYVGVDKSGNKLKNIRELADEKGAKTAVVTTDVIGGATPGGFLAHNTKRKVNNVTNPDITKEIENLIANKKVEYTMGRSSDSYSAPNPDILTGTREALEIIAFGDSQFFMMIEGAYIDKRSHQDDIEGCVSAVKQYNEVIAYMSTFVFCHPKTALIVTADHETGALSKKDGAKYGYAYTNRDGTNSSGGAYRQHTNNDVPVYALGPKTEYFNNYRVENVCIPHFAAQAFGSTTFGDSKYYNNKEAL